MMRFIQVGLNAIAMLFLLSSCVEKIQFELPSPSSQIFVEGMISDLPGSYKVSVSEGMNLNSDTLTRVPISNITIRIHDDLGNSETLVETAPGDYTSSGFLKGTIGRLYHITMETSDGLRFESAPEIMKPTGEVINIRPEFESRQVEEKYGTFAADVFNIFIDAENLEGPDNYVRWRFRGTYKVLNYPEYRWIWAAGCPIWTPYPCSGVTVIPTGQIDPNPSPILVYPGPPLPTSPCGLQGKLSRTAPCACCNCYVNQFESIPKLSDGQLVTGGQFRNIVVAQVPITTETFYDKYVVEVEQMSMSRTAFEFFKLIRAQKEGAASLFQPPSGEIRGNITSVNNSRTVIGIFWATSIRSKSIVITKEDIPYALPPIKFIPFPCDSYYANSTTIRPAIWN